MIVICTGVDQGDGSLGVEFFESQEALDYAEDHDPETYRGEGGFALDVNSDIRVTTLQQLLERYGNE